MKLIIATESYSPSVSGVAVQAQRCAQWAREAGFEVMVITVDGGVGHAPPVRRNEISICGVKSIKNPWRPQNRISLGFWGNQKIRDEIVSFKPNLVHCHDPGLLGWGIVRIAKKKKIPIIAHHHFSEDFIKSYLKSFGPLIDLVFRFIKWYIRFVFVGDGNDRKNLEVETRQCLVSTTAVIFTGAIDRSLLDILAIYRSADIFWSASPIETQGIVFLEALASGVPVVAAQAGATVELIRPGENGELCPTLDANCFAEKILDLLKDKVRLEKYQKNGLLTVHKHSVENAKKLLLAIYKKFY